MPSRLPWLLLLICTTLPFLPLLTADFVNWDDPHNLSANDRMLPPTLTNTAWYWSHPYKDLYIPVTYTLWSAVAAVAQTTSPAGTPELNPYIFHTFNLLLHLASTCLVFLLLRRLTQSTYPACLAALLFALHPIQVESVAWISGAKDLLAGLFGLLSLYLLTIHVQKRCWPSYILATLSLLLALLSKPSAIVIPPIAFLLSLTLLDQPLRPTFARLLPWFLLTLPILLIAKKIQPASTLDYIPPIHLRPLVALDALGFYLRQLFFPLHLAIDYGRSPQCLLHSGQHYFTWLIPGLLLLIALVLRKRLPIFLLSLSIFTLALLPNLGLIPFDFQAFSTVADHYAYLALLAPALLLAILLQRFPTRAAYVLTTVVLLVLAVRTCLQTFTWQDSTSLFSHTLAINPDSLPANVNLARPIADRAAAEYVGQPETNRTTQAIPFYERALKTAPHDFTARKSLANMYKFQHRWKDAEANYRQALADARDVSPILLAETHMNLAAVLANQRRFDEALRELDIALQTDPTYSPAKALQAGVRAAR